MGRRTAEYTFSVASVCSVVNILDAPPGWPAKPVQWAGA